MAGEKPARLAAFHRWRIEHFCYKRNINVVIEIP
jgi:hypothetical protein